MQATEQIIIQNWQQENWLYVAIRVRAASVVSATGSWLRAPGRPTAETKFYPSRD